MIRLIGIDPGLRNTGWGVIDCDGNRLTYVADGVVRRSGNPVFVIRSEEKSSAKNKAANRSDGDQNPVGAGTGSDTR